MENVIALSWGEIVEDGSLILPFPLTCSNLAFSSPSSVHVHSRGRDENGPRLTSSNILLEVWGRIAELCLSGIQHLIKWSRMIWLSESDRIRNWRVFSLLVFSAHSFLYFISFKVWIWGPPILLLRKRDDGGIPNLRELGDTSQGWAAGRIKVRGDEILHGWLYTH